MRRILLFVALALLVTPGAARAQAGAAGASGAELHPGDRVSISLWRNQELSGTYEVTDDGTLLHPLYSAVQVAGVPVEVARERVHAFLLGFETDPKFVFVPHFRVYVGGAVRDQNQHFFSEISVAQAITQAGGATTPNDDLRVRLIRDGEARVVNLDGSLEASGLLQEPIRSGDQILVEERPSFMRSYVGPTLQVLQTVTSLVSTYVFFDAIFGS